MNFSNIVIYVTKRHTICYILARWSWKSPAVAEPKPTVTTTPPLTVKVIVASCCVRNVYEYNVKCHLESNAHDIRKTCLCNEYPLKPHFYIVKRVCRGIPIFLFSLQNIDCGYSLEPSRRGGSNVYPQSMFKGKLRKISKLFYCYNFKNHCTVYIAQASFRNDMLQSERLCHSKTEVRKLFDKQVVIQR